jgi:hypothetical protein
MVSRLVLDDREMGIGGAPVGCVQSASVHVPQRPVWGKRDSNACFEQASFSRPAGLCTAMRNRSTDDVCGGGTPTGEW